MGEKTGWHYLEIEEEKAQAIKPDTRTSYRVKGYLDAHPIEHVALVPMGEGQFILPLNATMRKAIHKSIGDNVKVQLEPDERELPVNQDFLDCLADVPDALSFFESLTKGHQNYYHNWISQAKTVETRTKRIMQSLEGFEMKMGYGEMIRHFKALKNQE